MPPELIHSISTDQQRLTRLAFKEFPGHAMAQNFNTQAQGSPPTQGFEDLMSSLRSPGLSGPADPMQSSFAPQQWPPPQWPAHWQQAMFPSIIPNHPPPPNDQSWAQNNHDGYIQFDQEEDDGQFMMDNAGPLAAKSRQSSNTRHVFSSQTTPTTQIQPPNFPGQIPSLSSSSPLTLPPAQFSHGGVQGSVPVPKSPGASSAATTARAAELRAKLLASRGPKSRQGSPAVRNNDDGEAKKPQLPGILKQQNNKDSGPASKQSFEPLHKKTDQVVADQAPSASPANATTLDQFVAEARDAAEARNIKPPPMNDQALGAAGNTNGIEAAANGVQQDPTNGQRPGMSKNASASDLSEPGEIRSGAGTPVPAVESQHPIGTEPEKGVQDSQDSQEKLDRQNEVMKIYQPLKKTKAQKPALASAQKQAVPSAKLAKTPQESRKRSLDRAPEPYDRPQMREGSRREHWQDRTREYDLVDVESGRRRVSVPQGYTDARDLERDAAARRLQLSEANARRAAEYKRETEARRASAVESTKSSQETYGQRFDGRKAPLNTSIDTSRNVSTKSNGPEKSDSQIKRPTDDEQNEDTVMLSPGTQETSYNNDMNDWLELTEYYDEDYRERRLKLYRKKKALDIQRAELEREEEMELQERTQRHRAQSVLTVGTPSSLARRHSTVNPRMPPPALPLALKDANKDDGMRIKDAALSAGLSASQTCSPTMKRQNAEENTETSPTEAGEKRARSQMNGATADDRPLTSPASARRNGLPFRNETSTFDNRMIKYDSYAPPPRRSRSPEYRRRSLSPRSRRDYSPPPLEYRVRDYAPSSRNDNFKCFNCGERGHKSNQCLLPRRDGKEWRDNERYISPNYLGKKPVKNPPPPRPPGETNSRVNSIGRAERQ